MACRPGEFVMAIAELPNLQRSPPSMTRDLKGHEPLESGGETTGSKSSRVTNTLDLTDLVARPRGHRSHADLLGTAVTGRPLQNVSAPQSRRPSDFQPIDPRLLPKTRVFSASPLPQLPAVSPAHLNLSSPAVFRSCKNVVSCLLQHPDVSADSNSGVAPIASADAANMYEVDLPAIPNFYPNLLFQGSPARGPFDQGGFQYNDPANDPRQISIANQLLYLSRSDQGDVPSAFPMPGTNPSTPPNLELASTDAAQMLDSNRMQKFYKTKPCPWYPLGRCRMGAKCNWAHTKHEMRPAVDLTRTKLCESFSTTGACVNPMCRFAHSREELRATSDVYKTSLCLFWMKGCCFVGANCRYAHGLEDLRSKTTTVSGNSNDESCNLEDSNECSSYWPEENVPPVDSDNAQRGARQQQLDGRTDVVGLAMGLAHAPDMTDALMDSSKRRQYMLQEQEHRKTFLIAKMEQEVRATQIALQQQQAQLIRARQMQSDAQIQPHDLANIQSDIIGHPRQMIDQQMIQHYPGHHPSLTPIRRYPEGCQAGNVKAVGTADWPKAWAGLESSENLWNCADHDESEYAPSSGIPDSQQQQFSMNPYSASNLGMGAAETDSLSGVQWNSGGQFFYRQISGSSPAPGLPQGTSGNALPAKMHTGCADMPPTVGKPVVQYGIRDRVTDERSLAAAACGGRQGNWHQGRASSQPPGTASHSPVSPPGHLLTFQSPYGGGAVQESSPNVNAMFMNGGSMYSRLPGMTAPYRTKATLASTRDGGVAPPMISKLKDDDTLDGMLPSLCTSASPTEQIPRLAYGQRLADGFVGSSPVQLTNPNLVRADHEDEELSMSDKLVDSGKYYWDRDRLNRRDYEKDLDYLDIGVGRSLLSSRTPQEHHRGGGVFSTYENSGRTFRESSFEGRNGEMTPCVSEGASANSLSINQNEAFQAEADIGGT